MKNRIASVFICVALILTILTSSASATSMQIKVPVGAERTQTIALTSEDHVTIKFTTLGQQDESQIDFWITGPNGDLSDSFSSTGSFDYRFVCQSDGNYVLHFSNLGFLEEKNVYLDYEIDHYIFGMPQMFFMTIIIAIVCVAAVAVFILMGRRPY